MDLKQTIDRCIDWMNKYMLTFDNGRYGVFERIRADKNELSTITRPDTASEYLAVMLKYKDKYKTNLDEKIENVLSWLESIQNKDENEGAFNFAFIDGKKEYSGCDDLFYQNDNGKIIILMCEMYKKTGEERFKNIALKCASFWIKIQNINGYFYDETIKKLQPYPKATCFVTWMMTAMFECYDITKDNDYFNAGLKAFKYCKSLVKDGRILSSFETAHTEGWRPVSSDNYIALYCFAKAYNIVHLKEIYDTIKEIEPFCLDLLDSDTGCIRNCNKDTVGITDADNMDLGDLVYTEGYGLNGLVEMYYLTDDVNYFNRAKRLAKWLSEIQIKEKEDKYFLTGAWRGSYSLINKKYEGICHNFMEEGGVNSAYLGWCALPILMGMLKIIEIED